MRFNSFLVFLFMWITSSMLTTVRADVPPPQGLEFVSVQNSIEMVPCHTHDYFLVSFPGPQFKSDTFHLQHTIISTKTEIYFTWDLSISSLNAPKKGFSYPHNHAYIVALTTQQQIDLVKLLLKHPEFEKTWEEESKKTPQKIKSWFRSNPITLEHYSYSKSGMRKSSFCLKDESLRKLPVDR